MTPKPESETFQPITRLVMARLEAVLADNFADDNGRTHFEECWRAHAPCAIRKALDLLAAQAAEAAQHRQEKDTLRMIATRLACWRCGTAAYQPNQRCNSHMSWRDRVQTEIEHRNAWQKRAEQAEADLATLRAQVETLTAERDRFKAMHSELATLAGSALVLATLDTLAGERPAQEPEHALPAAVWRLIQERDEARAANTANLREMVGMEGRHRASLAAVEVERDRLREQIQPVTDMAVIERCNARARQTASFLSNLEGIVRGGDFLLEAERQIAAAMMAAYVMARPRLPRGAGVVKF